MFNKLLAIVILATAIACAAIWHFFGEVAILGATLLFNLIKGITLKEIGLLLLSLTAKWILIGVPMAILKVLAWIGLPSSTRRKIKWYIWRTRESVRTLWYYVQDRFDQYVGERGAIALAIIATFGLLAISVFFFGFYLVWIFGGKHLLRVLKLFWQPIVEWLQNLVFRSIMFKQIDRMSNYVLSSVSKDLRQRYHTKRFGVLKAIKRRQKSLALLQGKRRSEKEYDHG